MCGALRAPLAVVQNRMLSRTHRLAMTARPEPFGARLTASLPAGAAGAWCRLQVTARSAEPWWIKAELQDEARGQIVREVFLGPARSVPGGTCRETLLHVPQFASAITLLLFGPPALAPDVRLAVMARTAAFARLAWQGRRLVPRAIAGGPRGAAGLLRALLGQAPARAGEAPPYQRWLYWFAPGPPGDPPPAWDAEIAITAGDASLTQGSLEAASDQGLPVRLIQTEADWHAIRAGWVIIAGAGEILAREASRRFARAAAHAPWAACLTADFDHLDTAGRRHSPVFEPGPDPLLLPSGLPVRGACAFRWRDLPKAIPVQAEAARLLLARRRPQAIAHVPHILTHRQAGLAGAMPDKDDAPSDSLKSMSDTDTPPVTIIVPTAARSRHVVTCVSKVVLGTDYPNVAVRLAVPPSGKPAILRRLAALPHVTLTIVRPPFNFAAVNNDAAAIVNTRYLLFLNDDVTPIHPHWLHAMVRHMHDPKVGIVGARLLYGNGMVQHEGVIMGLANLCEHAGRLREGQKTSLPQPDMQASAVPDLGLLDRQVSAVTAACLLIRTSLFHSLGGMDTAYAIALNDVDLCLRAREAGWNVVYCASAELYHYESLSLGRHYSGGRAALESGEVRLLRSRFASVIASDPFYSPNASLQPGREWQPAFPPRAAPPALGTAP